MLNKDQVIRLLMLVDQAIEDDEIECELNSRRRYDSLYQCELFPLDETAVKETLEASRKMWKFDEELREIIYDGLRMARFQEETQELLSKLEEDVKTLPEIKDMGKVLIFKKRG